MNKLFQLNSYFSEEELIRILCKKRARAAKKAHDDHFFRNVSDAAKIPGSKEATIYSFFPTRKDWIRADLKERNKRNLNAFELNKIQLERTVWRYKKKYSNLGDDTPLWMKNLYIFIREIRNSVFSNSNYSIKKPDIHLHLKDLKRKEYRPISTFTLKDLIIIGQISKYLTDCLDPLFLACSYAFRSSLSEGKRYSHHEAIKDILKFREENYGDIYVAECDIKKFYDCVNHDIVREKFNSLIKRAYSELGIVVDEIAIKIFESYLSCFSFYSDIYLNEKELLEHNHSSEGKIPWVTIDELLTVNSNPENERIGIPQGGALSCLIANIMMDSVDRKILEANNKGLFYARFCDDMVLLSSDKHICERTFEIYQEELKKIKLISHKPSSISKYSSTFWSPTNKSKLPYKWCNVSSSPEEATLNVPWLSFVGYQVRYDGVIRVRKTSIEKELKKQVAETGKIIRSLKKSGYSKVNAKAVKFRLHQRLISMSVGRLRFDKKPLNMCWAAGFTVIKKHPTIMYQFKKLDRNREKQLKRFERFLHQIVTPRRGSKKIVKVLKYYGSKYSYHEQFIKKEKI
jgi:hypothetical protein